MLLDDLSAYGYESPIARIFGIMNMVLRLFSTMSMGTNGMCYRIMSMLVIIGMAMTSLRPKTV